MNLPIIEPHCDGRPIAWSKIRARTPDDGSLQSVFSLDGRIEVTPNAQPDPVYDGG